MVTIHRGVTSRRLVDKDHLIEPLAVSPRQACVLLSVGTTRLYQLIASGEVEAYLDGRARRITMQSIRARVARLTGLTGDKPQPARRSRSRNQRTR